MAFVLSLIVPKLNEIDEVTFDLSEIKELLDSAFPVLFRNMMWRLLNLRVL